MGNETAKILIETAVRRTLRDFPDAPERSLRNLVDMGLNFSDGPFQRELLRMVQRALQNSASPYFGLARDMVDHVEEEKLLGFGMALGYNGCVSGASEIRERERLGAFHIPWSLSLTLEPGMDLARCQEIVTQGEALGIHTWSLRAEAPLEAMPLVQCHRDSAFVLLCRPGAVDTALLDAASEPDNLMLAVRLEPGAEAACARLREAELLYCVFYVYGEADRDRILEGDIFAGAEQLHPAITALLAEPACPPETRREIYEFVRTTRREQPYQTVVWDFLGDGRMVDEIISREAHGPGFDETGQLMSFGTPLGGGESLNMREHDLADILRRAFPREEA